MIRPIRFMCRISAAAAAAVLTLACIADPLSAAESTGTLRLTIRDAATGEPVPARVEVRGADGAYHVAEDALRYTGDCSMSEPGSGIVDEAASLAPFADRVRLDNPYTRSAQFYSSGTSSVRMPAGSAKVRVFKGPEYAVSVETVDVPSGATTEREIRLTRWINMPERGWYSADDHLHIARPTTDANPLVSKIMQAEDIHVANLLQMGKVKDFTIAEQYAHGPKGHYQEGHYILAAGQENPRTHFLGHTITLGAAAAHHDPENYLLYRLLWQATAKEGALHGYAHAVWPHGSLLDPQNGIAVVAPHDLLHFVEVLQFNRNGYESWYDLLSLGFRITPTAGTDYPCGGQLIPGHERFYARVEGPLTYAKWLESVRRGRTFVTTGPVVEFRVGGQELGSEIVLEKASNVDLAGSVVFDPTRDDVAFLELVQNGTVIDRFSRIGTAARIEFKVSRPVDASSWFAVRGYGTRFDENAFTDPVIFGSFKPTTNVHTAPIYVLLKDGPGIETSARAKAAAKEYLARLTDMERLLTEENLDALAARLENPNLDAVPKKTLLKNRQGLLREVGTAKAFFEKLAR